MDYFGDTPSGRLKHSNADISVLIPGCTKADWWSNFSRSGHNFQNVGATVSTTLGTLSALYCLHTTHCYSFICPPFIVHPSTSPSICPWTPLTHSFTLYPFAYLATIHPPLSNYPYAINPSTHHPPIHLSIHLPTIIHISLSFHICVLCILCII